MFLPTYLQPKEQTNNMKNILNFIFVVVILATTGFGSIAEEQKTKL